MSGGFNPIVVAPGRFRVQTESDAFQKPFFFGGSQEPIALGMRPSSFSGSGLKPSAGCGMRGGMIRHRGAPSINRPVRLPYHY